MTAAWKKLRFILSVRSDFHIIDSLLIAVHAFVNLVSMSFSVDSTLSSNSGNIVNLREFQQTLNSDILDIFAISFSIFFLFSVQLIVIF